MTINEQLKAVEEENESLKKENEELRRLLSRHIHVVQAISVSIESLREGQLDAAQT